MMNQKTVKELAVNTQEALTEFLINNEKNYKLLMSNFLDEEWLIAQARKAIGIMQGSILAKLLLTSYMAGCKFNVDHFDYNDCYEVVPPTVDEIVEKFNELWPLRNKPEKLRKEACITVYKEYRPYAGATREEGYSEWVLKVFPFK